MDSLSHEEDPGVQDEGASSFQGTYNGTPNKEEAEDQKDGEDEDVWTELEKSSYNLTSET